MSRSSRIVCIQVQWNHSDLSGCAPRGGVLAGRCVEKGYIELSRTELGLTLDSRSATLELSALRLGITLGASHTPTESCLIST